jgi:ketosteroid isomerase-like protein
MYKTASPSAAMLAGCPSPYGTLPMAFTRGNATAAVDTSETTPVAHDGPSPDPVIDELVDRATRGHIALMQGDVAGYLSAVSLDECFTLMSPFGGASSRGNRYTAEEWTAIGSFFRNGRDSTFELLASYRSADLAVLTAIERTHVEVGGLPAQPWTLRVTLVFRRHGSQWRLAHRHADPLGAGIDLAQSAALAARAAGKVRT